MKANKEPLIHISRRLDLTTSKTVLIKAIAICSGFIFALLLLWAFSGIDPISSITSIIMGNFSTPRRFWISIRETCLLLLVGLSLLPAFTMKYWNIGANGQIIISAMLCSVCMF